MSRENIACLLVNKLRDYLEVYAASQDQDERRRLAEKIGICLDLIDKSRTDSAHAVVVVRQLRVYAEEDRWQEFRNWFLAVATRLKKDYNV